MWLGFDGKPYTREQWTDHVLAIPRERLAWCKHLTLHNTAAPTLAQWAEIGPAHDARVRNLEHFYENEKGWHAGPHAFISRTYINGFSDLTRPGVHSRCFNASSIGLEMVGNYDVEEFESGDGALVAEMAVHAMAVLHHHIGLKPDGYEYGKRGLHFHVECARDNHDCPGKKARIKPALIARIFSRMAEIEGGHPYAAPIVVPPPSPRVPAAAPRRIIAVTATEFGGRGDAQDSAYGGRVDPTKPQVALPARLASDRRSVRVILGGRAVVCRVNDVGPWNVRDAYWERPDGRPATEAQLRDRAKAQNGRVPTNDAGIDMTPAVFEALGAPRAGKLKVDWEFAP